MLFKKGNSKLGSKIWTFSIPAGDTCPYKTEACSKECYAAAGFFLMPNVKRSLEASYEATKANDFAAIAIAELKKIKAQVCRVHVAGDLYSIEYAKKWLKIFQGSPDCRFFIYTRSWRGKEFSKVLSDMAKCKNVKLWYSIDKDTGKPNKIPKNVRLAYMQVDPTDIPSYSFDLTFRVDRLVQSSIAKKVGNATVCPPENGVTKNINCMKCSICYTDKSESVNWNNAKPNNKISLPVINGI